MSSPIRHAKDIDAGLIYAPPWARDPQRARPAVVAAERRSWNWLMADTSGDFSGDRAMSDLQREFALNPERVPEPPPKDASSSWPLALRLCAVGGVAAFVAWGLVSWPATRKPANVSVPAEIAPAPIASNQVKVVQVQSAAVMPAVVAERFTAQTAAPPQVDNPPVPTPQVENPPPPVPPSAAPQSVGPPLVLDADEIATLVKRGKDYMVNGDLASARLLLRRAAEGGSAEAALALGATFDPLVIARLGAIGAEPDIARARQWYRKATELGSADASRLLEKLAQSHQ